MQVKKRMSTAEYIKKAINKNGSVYDYSETKYIHSRELVNVICNVHGKFSIRADRHLQGQGCNACAHEYVAKCNTKDIAYFIKKANGVHNNFYDYSKSVYVDVYTKLKIICPTHGEFWQTPQGHYTGRGCNRCGVDRTINIVSHTTEQFVDRAIKRHGDGLDYSQVVYISNKAKVDILCPAHGLFSQQAGVHLAGSSCPECAKENNSISKRVHKKEPHILYYIKLEVAGVVYYKIGVTSQTVEERFKRAIRTGAVITTLSSWYFEKGGDAFVWEDSILKVYKEFKTKDRPLHTGNTEVFDTDILGLDT